MPTRKPETGGLALSRRRFIVGCVSLTTAVGLTPGGARSTETQQRLSGDLFAFTAPDRREVVFAVALPEHPFGQTDREALTVRLHAGGSAWTIGPFALLSTVRSSSDGVRIFSGKVRQLWSSGESAAHLIAVATPAQELEKSSLRRVGGSHQRPRNPGPDWQPHDFASAGGGRPAGRPAGTAGTREGPSASSRRARPPNRGARRRPRAAPTIYLGPTASPPNCCLTRLSSILPVLAASPSRR